MYICKLLFKSNTLGVICDKSETHLVLYAINFMLINTLIDSENHFANFENRSKTLGFRLAHYN